MNDCSDNVSIYNGSESHLNEDFSISLQNSQMIAGDKAMAKNIN